MKRYHLMSLLLGLSLTASGGVLAPDGQPANSLNSATGLPAATSAPDNAASVGDSVTALTEASVMASLAALAITTSDSLQQISVAADRDASSADPLSFNDLALVMIGDGSTTSVRLLANVFNTRGVLVPPIETLTGPQATSNMSYASEADYVDPAALMLAHGTTFVLAAEPGSGGLSFSTGQKSMMIGGGVVASWGLLAAFKLMKLRRQRGRVYKKTSTKRRTVPLS